MHWIVFAVAAAIVLSSVLTFLARRYAQRRNVLDLPNDRSSHTQPTPRGGGIGIVVVVAAYGVIALWQGLLEPHIALALAGGLLIAFVGWLDDHRHVSQWVRLIVQIVSAVWAVYWLGGKTLWQIGPYAIDLGMLGNVVAALLLVWLTNLYNFMDGIDGFAGMEGAFVCGVGGLLLWADGATSLAAFAWVLAGGCVGFLTWNWPPAKVFMGDVGSAAVGFLIGVLAFASETTGGAPTLLWLVLAGLFVADATLTLFLRAWRGERWYSAHRSHAYQLLTRRGWSHLRVTVFALSINLLVLLPLVLAMWARPAQAALFAILGASVLAWLWVIVQQASDFERRLGNP